MGVADTIALWWNSKKSSIGRHILPRKSTSCTSFSHSSKSRKNFRLGKALLSSMALSTLLLKPSGVVIIFAKPSVTFVKRYFWISSTVVLSYTGQISGNFCFLPSMTGTFGSIIIEWRWDSISRVVAPQPVITLSRIILVGISGNTSFKYCPWFSLKTFVGNIGLSFCHH